NSKTVATIAGQGHQSHSPWPGIDEHHPVGSAPKRPVAKPRNVALNSPWDLLVHDKYLYIAMAGPHQIWRMTLDESEIGPYAGNGREDIVDGPLLPPVPYEEGFASFAQPSGLSTDGHELFVADSEGSSIRAVPFESSGKVKTILGTAGLHEARLFTFGDIDGPGDLARLQHALGVAWTEGKLYVADTYNNKIKVIDITKDTCTTIAGNGKEGHDDAPAESAKSATFDEPAGISAAGGKLYVADTNNHLIRVIDLHRGNAVSTFTISGLEPPKPAEAAHTASTAGPPPTAVAPISLRSVDGAVTLGVKIELPEGWKINAIAPMRYQVAAAGKQGPLDQKSLGKSVKLDHPSQQFEIRLPTTSTSGTEQLTVSVQYYYCQEGREGLCKASAATWQVPLTIAADAPTSADPLVAKAE
ncbi:MAG TPA: hypothetical protein VG713_06115, partial [Pirellulales bacterium]|nr:hypothetical protein [Pirellulales bacterium]